MLGGNPNKQALRDRRISRQLRLLFDEQWFVEKYGSSVPSGADPFQYYLSQIKRSDLAPNPFFDPEWYEKKYSDVDLKGLGAVEHYILHGDAAGYNPGPLFHVAFFREMNPNIPSDDTALAHFMTSAGKAFPNPLFDSEWYAARYKVTDPVPLRHFVTRGWCERLDPSPMFSTAYYLFSYPDVELAGVNPLADYLEGGDRRGRNPGPYFDSSRYLETYPDIAAAPINALVHYVRYGYIEGRQSSVVSDSADHS